MTDDTQSPVARRRIILRRTRGGFTGGVSTHSESLRADTSSHETDEVDDAIEPENMPPEPIANRIRTGQIPPPDHDGNERENPRARMNAVQVAGSAAYAKEYRLQMLHRLLMRNVPLDQIASQFQVSISTVEKDRAELKRRLREAATQLNIDEMVGNQNAVYDEIAGMALRIASSGARTDANGNPIQAVPTPMKLAAMRTALAANADRTRFLNTAGVFDVLRFRRAEDGSNVSDVQQLMTQTMKLMDTLDDGDEVPVPPRRAGGFGPMTFDDSDASGSANEVDTI